MSAAVLLPRETRTEPFGISKWLFAQHGLLLVECGFGALFGNAPTGVGRASVVRYGSVLLPRETRNDPFGISKWLFARHGLLLVERGFGALFGNAPTSVGRR